MRSYKKKKFSRKRRSHATTIRRVRKKPSLFRKRIFWDFILGVVFVCSLFYLLFVSSAFEIKEIEIISPSGIFYAELRTLLVKELQKKHFWLLPGDSLLLANCSKMEAKILQEFPEIEDASLKKKLPKTIVLEVEKRQAAGSLCYYEKVIYSSLPLVDEDTDSISSPGEKAENVPYQCFLITEQGIIFREISKEEVKEGLVILLPREGIKELGEEAFSQRRMNQVLEINKVLKDRLKLNLQSFVIEKESSLTVKTDDGWEIYFDLEGDIVLALTKLDLLLEKEISQEKRKNLQYIDLRFSKVYYK